MSTILELFIRKSAVSYLIQNEDGGARQTTTIASYGFIPLFEWCVLAALKAADEL